MNTLYRIDPSTNKLVDTVDIGDQGGVAPAMDPTGAWISVAGGVQRFDTLTTSFVGSVVKVSAAGMVPDGIGGAWTRVGPDQTHTRSFIHIDASGDIDREVDVSQNEGEVLAGIAYTLDPTTGALWIVHYKDSVTRFDLGG